MRQWLYAWYARRLQRGLMAGQLPQHVAVVMDGNRRWARQVGLDSASEGHQHGAEHLERVLTWCAELGIHQVTAFVCSADNLRKRGAGEVDFLMQLAEHVIAERLNRPDNRWRLHIAGQLDTLPESTAHALKATVAATQDRTGYDLTLAIGYDGRTEIVDALRGVLDDAARAGQTVEQLAETLDPEQIAAHLYTRGLPDPDLVIRTSGEQRLGGFLLWQTAHSELHFCDVYWPGFRRVDFLRALRSYAARRSAHPAS